MNSLRKVFSALIAGAALACLLPVLAAVAAIILLGSPGPLLVGREVARQDGSRFRLYRFRIARGDNGKISPTGRVFRRLHLDLLPLLWNAARGDAALTDLALGKRIG